MCAATLGSCSRAEELPFTGGKPSAGDGGMAEISLSLPSLSTRTSIEEDNYGTAENTLVAKWDAGDSFGMLIRGAELDERFDNLFEFTHSGSGHDVNNEIFTGSIPFDDYGRLMPAGTFDYYAIYPMPSAPLSGTTAVCTIPVVQSGRYDDGADLMWAQAAGPELDNSFYNHIEFNFKHLTHALRITVPEETNRFSKEIDRITIEFPRAVAGDVLVDCTDGSMDMSPLKYGTIEVHFDENYPFESGKSFWVYTAPVKLSGAVRFTAYNDTECLMSEYVETESLVEMAPQRITPVKLGLPRGFQVTWFDYAVDWSQLGEPVDKMTLTLPEGYEFADGNRERSVFEVEGRFRFPIRSELLAAKPITEPVEFSYDSEHAIVPEKKTIADQYNLNQRNDLPIKAPYLFYEDFSGVTTSYEYYTEHNTSDATNHTPISLAGYGLPMWTGTRVGVLAGVGLRIQSRIESGLWVANRMYGRAESAPVANLKDGMSVPVNVTYNYSGARYNATGGNSGDILMSFGYDSYQSTQNGIEATVGLANPLVTNEAIDVDATGDGLHYGQTIHERTFVINSCDADTRLCWKVYNNRDGSIAANGVYWLYIDNVRVSIAQ